MSEDGARRAAPPDAEARPAAATTPVAPTPGTATTDILVAGTAGGVGTTTVAALIFAAMAADELGAPLLLDHTAGELGLRLPDGDDVRLLNDRLALHDLGPHAHVGVGRLAERENLLVLVAPATPVGCAAIGRLLEPMEGQPRLQRLLVVLAGVFGRHRIAPQVAALGQRIGPRSVLVLPRDHALAAGGRIPTARLAAATVNAQHQLAGVLRERLRAL